VNEKSQKRVGVWLLFVAVQVLVLGWLASYSSLVEDPEAGRQIAWFTFAGAVFVSGQAGTIAILLLRLGWPDRSKDSDAGAGDN
jgi:hypothetical protein